MLIFMNVLVILGHPNPCSFNHALAHTTVTALQQLGHTVMFHDLYGEGFDPTLELSEMQALTDPNVRRHTEDLANADGVVIIHPIWWGQPPAILKGWIDRVFRVGVAYRFQQMANGEGVPVGLLKAQKAVIFNTSNTKQEAEELRCKDAMGNLWKVCILDLCGVKNTERRLFSPMMISTSEQRQAWLKEAEEIIRKQFAK